MAPQQLVGRVGTVTTRVRGGTLAGEVRLVVDGLPQHFLAYAHEPVEIGRPVLVIHNRGSRHLDVEPWLDPAEGVADALADDVERQ